MLPAAERSPSANSSNLSGRRIISRIASPFTSKSRNVDLSVDVDDPHRQYSQGDSVTGSVRLRVTKPLRVTHVVACLHGFVQVYKNPGPPSDISRPNAGHAGTNRANNSGEYFGNGFVSLFEDEVVLCGDGRLVDGSYQFNFELLFPDKDLPSSIEFERGTVSYMVTATLTRPTAISPTLSFDHRVFYVERIDISPLRAPKARTITLEPISRRSRARHQARRLVDPSERKHRMPEVTRDGEQGRHSRASSLPSSHREGELPVSPAPSELSFDSLVSSNGTASQPETTRPPPGASEMSHTNLSKTSLIAKSITATVETLRGGCLRGDNIGVKVNINHTKPIKSLYGVIITLYRQARVDMHPAIPLGPTEKGTASKYEDYYPRSLTGLGGLSLSGAGSSHVFRKDLTQTVAPMYVDPITLTTEIQAKVRVPEEAFATISSVPGGMLSFKYYVEVVLDIQGKLSSPDRNIGNLGGLASGQLPTSGFRGLENEGSASAPPRGPILDTSHIRRDKGVVTCVFEVIIGTQDSDRKKGKGRMEVAVEPDIGPQGRWRTALTDDMTGPCWYNNENQEYYDWQGYEQQPQGHAYDPGILEYVTGHEYHSYEHHLPAVPIPRLPDESQLSEKERMRSAEARLLPSQPPGMTNGLYDDDDDDDDDQGPSAPYLHEDDLHDRGAAPGPSAPAYQASRAIGSPNGALPETVRQARMPVVPEYESSQLASSASPLAYASDDKQELRRRQLQAQASTPPDPGVDGAGAWPSASLHDPSAPTAAEADAATAGSYDSHASAVDSLGLPRYEPSL